ncbi:MAG: hypothetical protein NTU41_04305 [Chloroflexi bacterium]|nr:hypothetical protein [Chloroflexota bacterium]
MTAVVYIGLDDTDMPGTVGTGRVARELASYLEELGMGRSLGVTRHQLLVDPRIPYTSHNSSLCLAMEGTRPVSDWLAPCTRYVLEHSQSGADPGVCLCEHDGVTEAVREFGRLATSVVLSKSGAVECAARNSLFAVELGGTGGGIIGAIAAVGLRHTGCNGRYVGLRGIREVAGCVSAGDLVRLTDIAGVVDGRGQPIADAEVVDTLNWVRPSLVGGRPVLRVEPDPHSNGRRTWIPIKRKQAHEGLHKERTK